MPKRHFRFLQSLFTRREAPSGPLRVVIDTNSLVASRFKEHGRSARLVELCIDGTVQALVSRAIMHENTLILRKVKPPKRFWNGLDRLYEAAEMIENLPQIEASEDPADNKFLECAVGGKANYIISSDRHLLDLDGYEGVRVCHAGAFFDEHPELKQV